MLFYYESWELIKSFMGIIPINVLNILNSLKKNNYSLYVAQMQSGKTTTYLSVASNMLFYNMVKEIIIFSGNRETELRIQTQERAFNKCTVVWGTQLHHFKPNNNKKLYIWDESHYGQTKNQQVHKFLSKCNLNANNNEQNNNYLLSVSATPFSELYNINPKYVIWSVYNSQYWSVKHMLNKQIVGYDDIELLIKEIKLENKYSIIRYSPKYNIKSILEKYNINYILYDQTHNINLDIILQNKPKKHTSILIKGKLQMGKTIQNKTNIQFCIETSQHKKTDALLQGFIGRFCGYNTNKNTIIYIPNNIINNGELNKYIDMFENKTIYPNKGMNLIKNGTNKKEVFN